METNSNSDNNLETVNVSSFKEFRENPSYLLQLVNKYVQVQLIKNISKSGFIHTIDPIGYSIILLEPWEDKLRTTLIPGHAILDVCVKEPDTNLSVINKYINDVNKNLQPNTQDIAQRKIKLLQWLNDNKLPIAEVNDNIVIQNVTILPPYNVTNVCSDNPILQMHICNLIDRMPS